MSNQNLDAATRAISDVTQRLIAAESALGGVREALAAVTAVLAASPTPARPDALTMEDVAEALQLSRSTVAVLIKNQTIPSLKIGGARRVWRRDLDAFIESQRAAA